MNTTFSSDADSKIVAGGCVRIPRDKVPVIPRDKVLQAALLQTTPESKGLFQIGQPIPPQWQHGRKF
jgi:hypothetical protein